MSWVNAQPTMTNCRQLRYFSIFEAASSQQSVIIIVAVGEVTEASCGSSLIDEAPRLVSSCDASDCEFMMFTGNEDLQAGFQNADDPRLRPS